MKNAIDLLIRRFLCVHDFRCRMVGAIQFAVSPGTAKTTISTTMITATGCISHTNRSLSSLCRVPYSSLVSSPCELSKTNPICPSCLVIIRRRQISQTSSKESDQVKSSLGSMLQAEDLAEQWSDQRLYSISIQNLRRIGLMDQIRTAPIVPRLVAIPDSDDIPYLSLEDELNMEVRDS